MKAVGYKTPGPIDAEQSLVDVSLPEPTPSGRDLLVEVRAISVNPVDYKVRRSAAPQDGGWKVLGWDAAGVVHAVGAEATLFKPGDAVFYAGSIARPGTNAELHLVDERIVGRKPASLDWAEAAALPLHTPRSMARPPQRRRQRGGRGDAEKAAISGERGDARPSCVAFRETASRVGEERPPLQAGSAADSAASSTRNSRSARIRGVCDSSGRHRK